MTEKLSDVHGDTRELLVNSDSMLDKVSNTQKHLSVYSDTKKLLENSDALIGSTQKDLITTVQNNSNNDVDEGEESSIKSEVQALQIVITDNIIPTLGEIQELITNQKKNPENGSEKASKGNN